VLSALDPDCSRQFLCHLALPEISGLVLAPARKDELQERDERILWEH
jgi:hypothetical protein